MLKVSLLDNPLSDYLIVLDVVQDQRPPIRRLVVEQVDDANITELYPNVQREAISECPTAPK
jgi:hypothetical protein